MHHIRVLKSDCCGWSKSGLWPSSRCTSNKQNQSWRRRPAITDQMRWPTQSALWVCLDLTTSYKHIDDSECGCDLKTQTQVTITINHNGKRVKAPWHQHRGAIVTCFLWLTNYGLGSGGGIPDWWDMQPLGGEIYWYGFCAATGALNQCDQAGGQREMGLFWEWIIRSHTLNLPLQT